MERVISMANITTDEKIAIINRYHANPEQALNILIDLQFTSSDGYIDQATAQLVAEHLGVTETRIYEMVSFYAILKEEPQARYVMKICNSAPCHFSGEQIVSHELEELLDIQEDQMTNDGMFMYHSIPCVGACAQAPFIKIKDRVFANLTADDIAQLISDLRAGRYPEL